jgi:hypothetical protein
LAAPGVVPHGRTALASIRRLIVTPDAAERAGLALALALAERQPTALTEHGMQLVPG